MSNPEKIREFVAGDDFLVFSGFQFVSELRQDAYTSGVSEQIIKDWKTIENWLGCENRPLSQQDKDRIGRAWKSYCGVGIAPSINLQPAFNSFHKQAKNERWETVSVPSLVRDVFDRLLATESEIAEKKRSEQQMLKKALEDRKSKPKLSSRFLSKQRRIWIVGLVIWSAYVIFRTSDYYEVFGVELRRWDSNYLWLNLLLPPLTIVVGMYVHHWIQRGNR